MITRRQYKIRKKYRRTRKRRRRNRRRRRKKRRKRTRKGGKKRSRRTKFRRPYVMVKIERNPFGHRKLQRGGFLGGLAGGLAKTAMGALGGGSGGGLMDTAKNMGKDILGRAKGGLMDKIGGFVNEAGGGMPGLGGGMPGGGELLGGVPSVKLEECDPSERPEYPKGTDGCGKHESPKPTVQQLKQGYVDEGQVHQLDDY